MEVKNNCFNLYIVINKTYYKNIIDKFINFFIWIKIE